MSVKSMHAALMEMKQNQSEAVAYNTKAAKSRLDDRRETNSRMLKRDFNKSGISHTHSTKTGPDGSKHDHFDIGKHTKVISTHNSYKVLHKGKETHYQGDPEHRDNRNRVIDKVLQHVGKNESVKMQERASWVPESILDDDVSHFMGAAAAAKKAGKSHFDFGGKKYKVTMKSDAAKKIGESAECPTCRDGECQCEQPVQEAKISELSSKTLSSYIKKSAADAGSKAWDAGRGEHDKLGKSLGRLRGIEKATDKLAKRAKKNKSSKEESVEEATKATAQHKPTPETSDTWDKQLATRKGEKDFIDQHTMDVALDAEKIYQQNKYEALSQTPARRGDQKVGDKNPVNPVKANPIEGMRKVLAGIRAKG